MSLAATASGELWEGVPAAGVADGNGSGRPLTWVLAESPAVASNGRPADDLDAGIWPATARRVDGVLTLGGLDCRDLAAEFGTPLFVLDEADFRARCRAWLAAFPDKPGVGPGSDVHYAGKAFLSTAVVGWLLEEGLSLDVCTGGELAVAVRAGMPGERILFHGNNKTEAELRSAVGYGVSAVVLDSMFEIARLASVATQAGVRQRVLIRVTPGVEAHTHEFISTGQEDQKFGFSIESGAAAEAVRCVLLQPQLDLVGLHAHIGSQIFDAEGYGLAVQRLVLLLADVRDEHGVVLPVLDLGGGVGIAYTPDDDPMPVAATGDRLRAAVARACADSGLPVPRLAVEPGRALIGPSTVTLYEVGTVKPLPGLRTYVSVDGGMSDNPRTALYGARYLAALASRAPDGPTARARVVGRHCETGDVVVKDVDLPADLVPGDLLAVPATGAYHRSMASNYNHVPRPPVVAVRDGQARLIVRRETEDDLMALDTGLTSTWRPVPAGGS